MSLRNNDRRTISHVATGLTKGTTSTYTTTAATECSIDTKWTTALAIQTNTATPTTDATTGVAFVAQTDDTACAYVFGITAAGAIAVSQGPVVATEAGSGNTAGAFKNPGLPPFPELPDNFCPIGYLFVRQAPGGSNWTFGSSNWTATGITASAVVEVDGMLPARPQALP